MGRKEGKRYIRRKKEKLQEDYLKKSESRSVARTISKVMESIKNKK